LVLAALAMEALFAGLGVSLKLQDSAVPEGALRR